MTTIGKINVQGVAITAAVLAVLGLAFWIYKSGVAGVAKTATKGVIDAGAGVVKGVSEAVGIPDTNQDECAKALAEGRYWDASFACPAGSFLKGVFSSSSASDANPAELTSSGYDRSQGIPTSGLY